MFIYYSNFVIRNIVKSNNEKQKAKSKLINQRNVWRNRIQIAIKIIFQSPPSILRLLSRNPRLSQCLFNCNNKNCKLCVLYIKPCANFKTSNNVIWYIRSHITCQSKNVIFFLKCTSCNYNITYSDKTVDLR